MPSRHRPTRSIRATSARLLMIPAMLAVPLASASPWCPADLNDDGLVDATDLSILQSQWGRCPPGGCPADLDGDGRVDGIDLTTLLSAWGICAPPPATILVGTVLLADGTPVPGASITTDLGGAATSGKSGAFELEVALPVGAAVVTLSAAATIGSASFAGSLVVSDPAVGATNEVGAITLEASFSCPEGFAWRPTFSPIGLDYWVDALAVFDDGSGPALFVGGRFTSAGGVPANCIAKWDGTSWSSLGSGTNFDVRALEVFDDGSGPKLYVGGAFSIAGGVNIGYGIARWNGSTWSTVGGGVSDAVSALVVHDDGTGPALYAGGNFLNAGGVSVNKLARWNGQAWSAVGFPTSFLSVYSLASFDDGTGPALYAGGTSFLWKWNGGSWSPFGGGLGSPSGETVEVYTLRGFEFGGTRSLFVGGRFTTSGGISSPNLAEWGCSGP